jgi:carboxyl-terminal processing protease
MVVRRCIMSKAVRRLGWSSLCVMSVTAAMSGFPAPSTAVAQPPATQDVESSPAVDDESESSAPGVAPTDQDVPTPATALEGNTPDEEYFELLKLFADTLDQVERNYVKEVSRRELMEAAIEGVLAKLDQYSDYIAPEQLDTFRRGVENEFGGIGIRVGHIDGKLVIITPLIDTPAYRAGLLTGDQILKVGDEDASTMSLEDAIERMKGKIGSSISLTVRHEEGGDEEQLTMQRELVRMETVFGNRRGPDDHWEFMLDDEHKIGCIRISTFSRHTSDDLKQALDQLVAKGMQGLILDLRFDPGGLLSTAVEVADRFLAQGTIVSTAGRNTIERTWSATEPGTYDGFDMVVLVNGYSASASEIVAASLQDHDRAVVIGQRTWGKGSVQNIIELEGGRSALKLTTAGYRRPSGKNIHRFDGATDDDDWGVRPDEGFEVALSPGETRRLLAFHRDRDIIATPEQREKNSTEPSVDRQLQKAIDYLREKIRE